MTVTRILTILYYVERIHIRGVLIFGVYSPSAETSEHQTVCVTTPADMSVKSKVSGFTVICADGFGLLPKTALC